MINCKCGKCGKSISEDEWVVNWGACADCFEAHVKKYLEEKRKKEEEGKNEPS